MNDVFPLSSPAYADNPFPFWLHLRESQPVYWSEAYRFWVITRYDDIVELALRPDLLSSSIGAAGGMEGREADAGAADSVGFLPMIQHDPPEHTRLRSLLKRSFTSRRMAELEPHIASIAGELAAAVRQRLAAGETVDLYEDFASPLPVTVIAELLGIPEERRRQLRFWNRATGVGSGEGFSEQQKIGANRQMSGMLEELIEERRAEPRDDLISSLVQVAAEEGGNLRASELLGFCKLLWIAGNETTTNLITNGALILQDRPDLVAALAADKSRVPLFVEEALRFEGPVNGLFRQVTGDFEFRGQALRAGDAVWLLWASGNRDALHYDRPDEFVLDRNPRDHLAFGHGIHFCLGAHLARLEARVAFETLVELLPECRCLPARGKRLPTPILRGWLELPAVPAAGA